MGRSPVGALPEMRAGRSGCGRPVFPAGLLAEAGVLAIACLLPEVAGAAVPGRSRAGGGRYAADEKVARRREYVPLGLIELVAW